MTCRNCGAGLEADRIDSSLGVVTCSHCGSLHDIPGDSSEQPPPGATASAPVIKPERLKVGLPSRFKLTQTANGMEVIWPVGRLFHGLVLSIIAMAFAHVALNSGMLPLLMVSAGLLYYAATRAFNQHHIRVDSARLQVSQGPLPWPGARKLDASDIDQLYATEHESRTETGKNGNRTVQIRKYYRLLANTSSSGQVTILSRLNDPHQALWLEQEIERLLNIGDKRVAGEHVL